MPKLDKEKFLKILKEQGPASAITALHYEKEKIEVETFEGPQGYQRELWVFLEEVRNFSVELWSRALRTN